MSDTESTNPGEKPVNEGGGGNAPQPGEPVDPTNTCPGPHGSGGGGND